MHVLPAFQAISLILILAGCASPTSTPLLSSSPPHHAQPISVRDEPNRATLPLPLPLPVEVIRDFPPGTWLENIAVRRNGQILTTVTTAPEIYQVDPCKERAPVLLHSFPATSVVGLAELHPDVFYVTSGNSTSGSDGRILAVPGSFAVWKLDLRGKQVRVSKIATVPKARLLNGVAVLDYRKRLLLIADSILGLIWQLNVHTREVEVFADDPLAKASPGAKDPTGINGIKVRNGAVYWTNTDQKIIARLDLKHNGTPKGPAVVVVKGIIGADDFNIGPNGAFFAAQNAGSALVYAPAAGGDAKILANITADPTAVAFGRRPEDIQSVYLSSARGKILKVNVKAFVDGYSRRD